MGDTCIYNVYIGYRRFVVGFGVKFSMYVFIICFFICMFFVFIGFVYL